MKAMGVFLITIFFIAETGLRKLSHLCAHGLLNIFGGETTAPGIFIEKVFSIGAPIFFVYFPLLVILWVTIKDGIQKFDWFTVPILIGIIFKASVYGISSFKSKGGEFWELSQIGVPLNLLWFFIILFLFSCIVGFIMWFKEIS
jgi:hypothetical protein